MTKRNKFILRICIGVVLLYFWYIIGSMLIDNNEEFSWFVAPRDAPVAFSTGVVIVAWNLISGWIALRKAEKAERAEKTESAERQ